MPNFLTFALSSDLEHLYPFAQAFDKAYSELKIDIPEQPTLSVGARLMQHLGFAPAPQHGPSPQCCMHCVGAVTHHIMGAVVEHLKYVRFSPVWGLFFLLCLLFVSLSTLLVVPSFVSHLVAGARTASIKTSLPVPVRRSVLWRSLFGWKGMSFAAWLITFSLGSTMQPWVERIPFGLRVSIYST